MPFLTLQLSPEGPIIDLAVGLSGPRAQAMQGAGLAVPQPVRIRGLLDTGASGFCLDPSIVSALGIPPRGTASMITPSTGPQPHPCNQYDVSLVLLHPQMQLTLSSVPALESALAHQGFHALIGREVLRRCLFVYDGQTSIFSLAF